MLMVLNASVNSSAAFRQAVGQRVGTGAGAHGYDTTRCVAVAAPAATEMAVRADGADVAAARGGLRAAAAARDRRTSG